MLAHWDICRGTQSDKRLPRGVLGAAEMPDVSLVPYQRVAASKLLWVLHKYLIFSLPGAAQVPALLLIYIYTNVISGRPTYIF